MKSRRILGLAAALLMILPTIQLEASALETQEQYIVEFISGVNPSVEAKALQSQGAQVSSIYNFAINGVSASMSPRAAAALAKNPRVKSINREEIATLQSFSEQNPTTSWGIDRIDQRDLPLDSKYKYENVANPVTIYIFDTGLNSSLGEFAGRVSPGRNFMTDRAQSDTSDCNGHGTHVAGTALGTRYGVAKSARVVPVRVLNCQGSGTATAILNGIDWVISQHDGNLGELAVANMSLGFSGYYGPVDTAVRNLVADGVATAVAAGNSNLDACTVTPASTPTALTVGASTSSDSRSSFSNWGGCVDIFAPGSSITSLNQFGTAATWNGTSMASPHVAGAAALLLSKNPALTPDGVRQKLIENSTLDKLNSTTLSGSPNRLLYTLNGTTTFTVTYNGNTNTSGSAPSDSNSYSSGALVTVLGGGSLVKSGFSFAGWCTAAIAAGSSCSSPNISYQPNNTFSISSNVTLYAQWTASLAPSQPGPPVLSRSSPNSIRVNWIAPNDNGAAITSYQLRVLRNGVLYSTVTVGSVTSHNLLGLPRGRYRVSVMAFNGLWSIESALSNEIRL